MPAKSCPAEFCSATGVLVEVAPSGTSTLKLVNATTSVCTGGDGSSSSSSTFTLVCGLSSFLLSEDGDCNGTSVTGAWDGGSSGESTGFTNSTGEELNRFKGSTGELVERGTMEGWRLGGGSGERSWDMLVRLGTCEAAGCGGGWVDC